MYAAINSKGEKVFIENVKKDDNYYCPCCETAVIVKNCTVKRSHFAHKSFAECDNWYEMSDWHYEWQNKFPDWNKQGFKYFGGYEYSVNGFMNYLRKLHKAEVII